MSPELPNQMSIDDEFEPTEEQYHWEGLYIYEYPEADCD